MRVGILLDIVVVVVVVVVFIFLFRCYEMMGVVG
jgi:hypothetical protein